MKRPNLKSEKLLIVIALVLVVGGVAAFLLSRNNESEMETYCKKATAKFPEVPEPSPNLRIQHSRAQLYDNCLEMYNNLKNENILPTPEDYYYD